MQYLGNQDGFVRYSYSRNWLPRGYNHEWKALKSEFYKPVSHKHSRSVTSSDDYLLQASTTDETWRKTVLIDGMNAWIDEQRDKPKHYGQSEIDANGEIFYVKKAKKSF